MARRNGKARTKRPVTRGRLVVRPALRGDLMSLEFFFDSVLRRDYFLRRGQLAEMLAGRYHQVHVAEIDALLVGVAVTTRGQRLVNALVHPAYRGLGIGRALVEASGAREVRVKTDMSTGDPRRFYGALGFCTADVQSGKGNIEIMRKGAAGVCAAPLRAPGVARPTPPAARVRRAAAGG